MEEVIGCILILMSFLVILVLCPVILIWALNTLFPFAIPVTFGTWLAASFLLISFGGIRLTKK